MTLLLLRCRARMAWTLIKPGSRKDWGYRILIAVLALIYSPLLVMMFWGIRVLSGTIAQALGIEVLLESARHDAQPEEKKALPDGLTDREGQVLRLLAAGRTNQQIADELFIAPNTVANHVKNILSKTATANRTEAAAYASSRGLV